MPSCEHDTTSIDDAALALTDALHNLTLPEAVAEIRHLGGVVVDVLDALPAFGPDIAARTLIALCARLDATNAHAYDAAVTVPDGPSRLGDHVNTLTTALAEHAKAHGATIEAGEVSDVVTTLRDSGRDTTPTPGMYL